MIMLIIVNIYIYHQISTAQHGFFRRRHLWIARTFPARRSGKVPSGNVGFGASGILVILPYCICIYIYDTIYIYKYLVYIYIYYLYISIHIGIYIYIMQLYTYTCANWICLFCFSGWECGHFDWMNPSHKRFFCQATFLNVQYSQETGAHKETSGRMQCALRYSHDHHLSKQLVFILF